jgi:hypothetical protein
MNNQTEALRLAQEINILFVSEWGLHSPMAKDSKIVLEEMRRLYQVNQELLSALKKAADDLEHWGSYVSDYFQEKHSFWSDVEAAHAVVAKVEGQS